MELHWIKTSSSGSVFLFPVLGEDHVWFSVLFLVLYADNTQVPSTHRPLSTQNCWTELCGVHWRVSLWTVCTATCGNYGFQSRRVECVHVHTNKPVQDLYCSWRPRPSNWQRCNITPCENSMFLQEKIFTEEAGTQSTVGFLGKYLINKPAKSNISTRVSHELVVVVRGGNQWNIPLLIRKRVVLSFCYWHEEKEKLGIDCLPEGD